MLRHVAADIRRLAAGDRGPTRPRHLDRHLLSRTLLATLLFVAPARADPEKLAPLIVSATRGTSESADAPVKITTFTAAQLADAPDLTLDDALRADPAFGLFRRTGSLLAHPTAQGVSLRGIGPSGASRSLVLLDGVPLNDPFGGWVTWTKIPRLALTGAEIMHGGGSGAWGNGALGGTVALVTAPPASGAQFHAAAEVGDFGLRSAEIDLVAPTPKGGALGVNASAFEFDGFSALASGARGPVDRPLDSMHRTARLAWRQPVAANVGATVTARWFTEERGNGTPLQRNRSREAFASVALVGEPRTDFAWQANAYAQRGHLSSFFSAVSADRRTETPASNQFDVPATAAGAAFAAVLREGSNHTSAGLDVRGVRGETREEFSYVAGRFTRRRFAGGAQAVGGMFAHHDRALAPDWRASLDLRLDRWENRDGHRREEDAATGALVRDDRYADRTGHEFSPGAGIVFHPNAATRLHAAAYRAFRLPTLNEYHRPFRAGTMNTEANPALARETLAGAEAGLDYVLGRVRFEVGAFVSDLSDAVGNVTLSRTGTTINRQRQNLDTVRVHGAEVSVAWTPQPGFTLRADYLLDDAEVSAARAQPALVGRRLAQVPRHTLCAGADAILPFAVRANARLRWASRQFEDDENLLPLASATTLDLRFSRRLGNRAEIYVAVENALNAFVATSRSVDGLVTRDTPRLTRGGMRVNW